MKKRLKRRYKRKNQDIWVNTIIFTVCLIIMFIVFNRTIFNGLYDYDIGNIVNEDIFLSKDVVDSEATEALKEQTRAQVTPVMYIDFSKIVEAKRDLSDFFTRLVEIKATYKDDPDLLKRVYAAVEEKNTFNLNEEDLQSLVLLSDDKIDLLKNYAVDITSENMSSGIEDDELTATQMAIDTFVSSLDDLRDVEKQILNKLISSSLSINELIDTEKTNAKIEEAIAKVDEITYSKGTLIVAKGEQVTADDYRLLQSGNMLVASTREKLLVSFGLFLMILVIWALPHVFLYYFDKSLLKSVQKYALLALVYLIVLLSSRFLYAISPYLLPIPVFVMLVGIMINHRIVLPFGLSLVAMEYLWHNLSAPVTVLYLILVLYTSILSSNVKQRSKLMMSGIYVSILMGLIILADTLIFKKSLDELPMLLVYAALNGAISSVITIGSMPFFESAFKLLTPFKLLELSNPNRDLLKRLLIEAPGTYHHSILVGNLAEAAAHDIGANSLLTRVASFYHDIGKLERPYYFKENQIGTENPHDKLPPQVSANIIRNHTTYGVELAIENKLPVEIREIIMAHHGTSLIKYFYHLESQKNDNVDTSQFVYLGPKPISKEAVIVMLADSVEAAVRSIENPTKQSIKELVNKIVSQKITENQLTESDISLSELETVKNSFLNVLSGIFHERISYPEVDLEKVAKELDQNKTKEANA